MVETTAGAAANGVATARQDADRRLSDLMRAAQEGDGIAYTALLREAAALLRRYVRSRWRTSDAADGEDLVQEILMSVHAVRTTYDPQRPFTPWLLAIARNRIADRARQEGRKATRDARAYDVELSLHPTPADPTAEPDREALAKAIDGLPASQKRAIELLKLQEMTLQEASRETGTSIGSLKLLVHRAMRNLRKTMGRT
jgi:RNA polymerase sigma-70 factor (ECF subfamily)